MCLEILTSNQAVTSNKLKAPTLVQLRAGISLQRLPAMALS